jgi:uncharacterized protein (DUF58 family)
MIVPRSRLLAWTAAVLLPFSLLGSLDANAWLGSVVVITGFVVLALIDAARAWGQLDKLRVELPGVARLTHHRAGTIPVRIGDPSSRPRRLRLGLPLPAGLTSSIDDLDVKLGGETEWSRVPWPCCPRERGNYRLRRAYLEGSSPAGFWAVRRSVDVECELRVYPNLLAERRPLAALFLNRGTFGVHAQRQVGKGREFEKLREYLPGDSFDEVHWKATAKRGRPVTKLFQLERTQEVYVILDASRLSARRTMPTRRPGREGSTAEPIPALERFVTSGLLMGLAAERQGDLFGLAAFSDKVERFVRAKNGRSHYDTCRDALYTLQPRRVSPDFDEVAAFLRLRLRRRALLVWLTDLDDPLLAESFTRSMELLCRQHVLLVTMLKPPGTAPLFTRADVESIDDLYADLAGHFRWEHLRTLQKNLQRRGVQFGLVEGDALSPHLVTQYVDVKRRQLL